MTVFTIGHGVRPLEELVETLAGASVGTLVGVRRFPGSRRNPQFNEALRPGRDRGSGHMIAELLTAQGHDVVHLIGPGRREPHRLYDESEIRERRLYLCGSPVG